MKKITILVAVIALALGANAQLLWKVEGNGLEKPSYLFGTHHIAPATMIDSIPGLTAAIDSAAIVVGEVQKDDMDPNALAGLMMQMSVAPADSTLDVVLDSLTYATADSLLASFTGMPGLMDQLKGMKPVIVSTQLAALQSLQSFPDFNPAQQLDVTVQTRGEAAGKATRGFETAEEQLAMLTGEPIATQAADLAETINHWSQEIAQSQALAEAYKAQDLAKVEAIMFDPETGMSAEHAQYLIFDRNERWISKMQEWMSEGSLLVTVGCGHLPGDKGLISLLQSLGYTVTAVE